MVAPNLLNPIKIKIEQINKDATQYDRRLRENRNVIRRNTEVELDAQIVYARSSTRGSLDNQNNEGRENIGIGGITEESDGYVLVKMSELTAKGITIKNGDKITKLAQLDVSYYVVGQRPGSHYTDQNGFTLLQIFFRDRNP